MKQTYVKPLVFLVFSAVLSAVISYYVQKQLQKRDLDNEK